MASKSELVEYRSDQTVKPETTETPATEEDLSPVGRELLKEVRRFSLFKPVNVVGLVEVRGGSFAGKEHPVRGTYHTQKWEVNPKDGRRSAATYVITPDGRVIQQPAVLARTRSEFNLYGDLALTTLLKDLDLALLSSPKFIFENVHGLDPKLTVGPEEGDNSRNPVFRFFRLDYNWESFLRRLDTNVNFEPKQSLNLAELLRDRKLTDREDIIPLSERIDSLQKLRTRIPLIPYIKPNRDY